MKTVRGFNASITPTHIATVPLHNDVPLADDERVTPPEIGEGEAWYAVTVAPRGERRTLLSLKDVGVLGYVPMETKWIETVKLKLKQKRETQRPILPGYVFLRVPADSGLWYDLKRSHRDGRNVHGIGGVIMNDGQPCRISARLLCQLASEERDGWFDERRRRALEMERNPELSGPLLRAGERLKIVGGAFATYEGEAEADSTSDSVRALVEIFGRPTIMTVSLDQVENLSRDVQRDPVGAMPIHRAGEMSGLAQSQNSAPIDWQAIEERRRKRMEHAIWQQAQARELKNRA
ncbi:transcription termination/antitermination protein NusG [Methylobacterium sp. NPDC080182]|uniref:transcription termination/antitermination protein NusG n=1 Tax=Methylobacterium sp. NPDC080182 TaxID=3390590 RepID=UPI003D057680